MKRIKKIASLLLAMTMVIAMTLPAFAADNTEYTITINKGSTKDETDHIYEAYQIFKGDLVQEGTTKVLSNIEWGANVDVNKLSSALKNDVNIGSHFAKVDTMSAAEVAKVLASKDEDEKDVFPSSTVTEKTITDTFAKIVSQCLTGKAAAIGTEGAMQLSVTGAGYYLVKDQDGSVSSNGAYTRILLDVVGDTTVNVKSDAPKGDKQVYISSNNEEGYDTDDANYGATIGSKVSYVISSNVPNRTGYNYYNFVMNDTLSKGLTFDENSVSVNVAGTDLIKGTDYYLYTGTDAAPYTFRLAFDNIMDSKFKTGDKIVVTYSATINDNAVIGVSGNANTWNLQYSNNPNETYNRNEEKPGLPVDETKDIFGQTPDEKTLTYLTELDITKLGQNGSATPVALKGAEFTLTGTSYQVVLKKVEYYEVNDQGTWYLLKDGTYTETAPATETDYTYVKIGVGTDKTTKGYILKDGKYVVPKDQKEYIDQELYKRVIANNSNYVDVNTTYEKTQKEVTERVEVPVLMERISAEDGKLIFKGLGEGTYTLTETFTPAGYNTIEPITFTIKFTRPTDEVTTGEEKCSWSISGWDEANNGYNSTLGIFNSDIVNKSGSTLPSTGGIGTTIFYVIGGILVVGAGILLITKRRMREQ